MSTRAHRLLDRARRSSGGWRRPELDSLYYAFGFEIIHGGKHDIAKHPDFPELRTTITRDRTLANGYIRTAIKLIEALQENQEEPHEH